MATLRDVLQAYEDNDTFANPNAPIAQAAVANAESGSAGSGSGPFNEAVNPSSGAYGLSQWLTPARQDFEQDFEQNAQINSGLGYDPGFSNTSPVGLQTAAENAEITQNYPTVASVLNNPNSTTQQMISALVNPYEAPGAGTAQDLSSANATVPQLQSMAVMPSTNTGTQTYEPDFVDYNAGGAPGSNIGGGFDLGASNGTITNPNDPYGSYGVGTVSGDIGAASDLTQTDAEAAASIASPEGGSTNIGSTTATYSLTEEDQPTSTSANPQSQSIPQAIDAQTKAAAADTTAQNKTAATDQQSQIKAGSSWLSSIEATAYDLFVRGGFVALGLVLVAGGILLFVFSPRARAVIENAA